MAEAKKDEEGKTLPAGAPIPSEEDTGKKVEDTPKTVKVGEKEYDSPEALATAYQSLESKLGEQGNELGTERAAKNAALQEIEGLKTAAEAAKAELPPASDYEGQLAEIYKDLGNAQKELDSGNISIEQAMERTNVAMQKSNTLTAEMAATKAVQEATQSFETTLQDRDAKTIQDEFLKDHADFAELRDSGKLAPIKQASPMHDDFSAYFAFKEALAFDKGKEEAARLAAGDEGTKTVLTKAGESIQKENIPKTPFSDAEAQDSMLTAINKPPA